MFTVGTIVGTHGLKGEVKIISRTDYPELRFSPGSELLLFVDNEQPVQLVVKSSRPNKSLYLVSFHGYDTIEQVEKLRGYDLKVSRSQAPTLPEGEYWIDDLVGCQVETQDGELLGTIKEVLTPGANDVYVVRQKNGNDILIPAIADCVLKIDVIRKVIQIRLMPGLLDETK